MTPPTVAEPRPELVTRGESKPRYRWMEAASSSDHKAVAKLYLGTSLTFLAVSALLFALTRLQLIVPDNTLIQPAQFIDLAESLGLIRDIDLRVVEKVLRHIVSNPSPRESLRYFVNLSRVSISDPAWVARFQQLLCSAPVRPGQLVFEITETAAMTEVDVTLKFIERLKEMGHRFALDDFGAGFSSFYYLKRFEVDYIKIDGGFIRDLREGNSNVLFVRALNDVARGLSKQVIAEGVETKQALDILLQMGAQYGQGYLFRSPYPLEGDPDSAGAYQPAVA